MASEVRVNFADGTPITAWLSFTMRESFTDPLGSLEFTCAPPRDRIDEYRNRLAKGQLVTILIDGVSQGGFLVQSREIAIGSDAVVMSIRCSSPLCTTYEGSVGKLQDSGAMLPITLKADTDTLVRDLLLEIFDPYGFSAVVGTDVVNLGARAGRTIAGSLGPLVVDQLKQQEAQSQEGEATYEFAARVLKRLGVVLHVGIDGELLVSAPDYDQESIGSLHQTFGETVAGSDRFLADPPLAVSDTNENQFSEVIVRGVRRDTIGSTGGEGVPVGRVTSQEFNERHPPYSSPDAAPYKPLYFVDKQARDVDRARAVATLIMGTHALHAFTVVGSVAGLRSKSGAIWTMGACCDVRVDAAGINEKMWILSREFSGSKESGQTTRLTLIPLGNLRLGEIPSG